MLKAPHTIMLLTTLLNARPQDGYHPEPACMGGYLWFGEDEAREATGEMRNDRLR
jgi:hypothetical protein